jgi:hypothetical protein
LNESITALNISLDTFHVVIANIYISPRDLGKYLAEQNYTGRLLAIPKFPFANQNNIGLS